MIAVIRHGGKQFVVQPGQEVRLEKIEANVGSTLTLPEVLLVDDGQVKLGSPLVLDAAVTATVTAHGRAPKVTIVKFHNKVRYRRKQGHRQPWTKIRIEKIR